MKYNTENTTDLQRTFAEMLQHYNYDRIKRIASSLGENPHNIGELIREFDGAIDKLLDSEDYTTEQETELALSIAGQIVDEIYDCYYIPQSIKVDPYEKFIEWEDANGAQRFENPRAIGLWDEDVLFHVREDFHYSQELSVQFLEDVRLEHGLNHFHGTLQLIEGITNGSITEEFTGGLFMGNTLKRIKSLYEEYQDAEEVLDHITYP